MSNENAYCTRLREILCPEGHWELSPIMENLLRDEINRLPRKQITEDERRSPTTNEGLKEFFTQFFVRHFFQIQDCIFPLLLDEETDIRSTGILHITDVGCGPTVVSLAISDLVNTLQNSPALIDKIVSLEYTLNDISSASVSEGIKLLNGFRRRLLTTKRQGCVPQMGEPEALIQTFPDSADNLALRRTQNHNHGKEMLVLSYLIGPLVQKEGKRRTAKGILKVLATSHHKPTMVVLIEDQFHENELRSLSRELGLRVEERSLTQKTYWAENHNETYSYTYYVASTASATAGMAGFTYTEDVTTQLQAERVTSPDSACQISGVSRHSEMGTFA